ncbi:hypothetical protein [Leptospira sp. id769339]|uniref:hypothetical protein n=1 Tax=Leptospira sp. id769339 TaxID=2864221 RepID=UPI00214B796F|nr:hypothetical protein [Leptospira sp. id769339]MCR1795735.1 hypothetical protein [Leptospira sp. id769339]
MNNQNQEILDWLRCAEEYLETFVILLENSLTTSRSGCTRPTIVNFGYFLENLLKAGIIRKNNLAESEIFAHVSEKLLTEAGYNNLSKSEREIVEFLAETVKWGKYPKRGKGDRGEMLSSSSGIVFSDQTMFFTCPNNLKSLLEFSFRLLEDIRLILCTDQTEEDKIYFTDTFDRLIYLMKRSLERLEPHCK